MKPEQLKLYQKYKYEDDLKEYIYIGVGEYNKDYIFLCKGGHFYTSKDFFIINNFDFDQIVNILNAELDEKDNIKDYYWTWFDEYEFEYIKPILKDKLKNIINR